MLMAFVGIARTKMAQGQEPVFGEEDIQFVADLVDAPYEDVYNYLPDVSAFEDSQFYDTFVKPRTEDSENAYEDTVQRRLSQKTKAMYVPETHEIVYFDEVETKYAVHELTHAVEELLGRHMQANEALADSETPQNEYIVPNAVRESGFMSLTYDDFVAEVQEETIATLVSLAYMAEHGQYPVDTTNVNPSTVQKVCEKHPYIPSEQELDRMYLHAMEHDTEKQFPQRVSDLAHVYGQHAVEALFYEGILGTDDVKQIVHMDQDTFKTFMDTKYQAFAEQGD